MGDSIEEIIHPYISIIHKVVGIQRNYSLHYGLVVANIIGY